MNNNSQFSKHIAILSLERFSNGVFWVFVIFACLYKLWLSSVVPFTISMVNPHDHTWFFLKALSISRGEWMGEYNHYTLIKGPVYSVFLSAISAIGISPKTAIDVLYLVACLVFLQALRLVLLNRLSIALAFVLVLFNPVVFSTIWAYTVRMNLYAPLILIYLSCLIALVSNAYKRPKQLSLYWSLLCGISLALAWNTREESIWLLPVLLPLFIITIWRLKQQQHWLPALVTWLCITAIPYSVWYQITTINEEKYGYRGVVDFKAPEFTRAATAIYSLYTGTSQYVYISSESIKKLKEINENTRQLASKLADEDGRLTKNLSGGYASWRIRSAMARNGHYQSFLASENAYKTIADDIEEYCGENPPNCRDIYIPGMLVKFANLKHLPTHIKKGISDLVSFDSFEPPDNLEARKRGDTNFQYLVGRYFKIFTGFNSMLEEKSQIQPFEHGRISKLKLVYRHYQSNFKYLVVAGFVIALLSIFQHRQWENKLAGLTLSIAFASSFGIYLIIATFAVPDLGRLLVSSSVPLLCFTGLYLGFGIQFIFDRVSSSIQSWFTVVGKRQDGFSKSGY